MSTPERKAALAYMKGYTTALVAGAICWIADRYFGEVNQLPWAYAAIAILTGAISIFLLFRNTRGLAAKPAADSPATAEANPAESDH